MRSEFAKSRNGHTPRRDALGFTLVELLITLTILAVVMGTVAVMIYLSSKSKQATSSRIESAQGARAALEMIADDLRSAGYGTDRDYLTPQPQIAYIDSTQVLINANVGQWPDTATVTFPVPRAYDPSGSPRPQPINGTAWAPPVKYRTGAEIIRYTLDADNDGDVDAGDNASALGALAARTPNPDDYVLLRQVYGDSVGNVAGNNGGSAEQIALLRSPGGTVPPMFVVYLKGSATPWNWNDGPVPASQLNNIERITVQVTAPSADADSRGEYAQTTLRTEVNSMRNVPNFGGTQHAVSGFVYNDLNSDNTMDAGEPGLSSVRVNLGSYSTYTGATGSFLFRVFPGTYTLRHTPPPGFTVYTNPDSFVMVVTGPETRSFSDVSVPGGQAIINVFEDLNDNNAFDSGEPGVPSILATLTPGPVSGGTDLSGNVRLFSPPGAFSVSLTLPDSFIVNTTPYPLTGTMIDGDSANFRVGLKKSLTGRIAGKVYRDNNRDGTWQSAEVGLQNVWVGVTNDGGNTILGYVYTNASGDYDIAVPVNDPPRTTPYSVFVIPPPGDFPTSATSQNGIWVAASSNTTGKNFGMAAYTIITLNASRVLSLSSADVIEKDWNGSQTQNARGDTDLILGADAGATDNISVWFNKYNGTPLFAASPTDPDGYSRLAPQSVLSIAVDTLDSDATWKRRPDIVTGTKNASGGNFFVWLNQNTSGNYGILPTSYSPGLNYRTNDNGDVQSVVTLDCAGGAMPDIIVGTKGTVANTGSIEVWQSNDAVSPTFTRQETYPSAGAIPGGRLGEVNAMVLADLNNDGRRDLIVGTRTSAVSGEIVVFRNVSKLNGARFVCAGVFPTPSDIVTALAVVDLDGDGMKDIVAGTQSGTSSGKLIVWESKDVSGVNWDFDEVSTQAADGIVMSMTVADFGGTNRPDIAVGTRANLSGYVGGVEIYYTDSYGMPPSGTDPSAGSIGNMVPALTTGNFNFGTNPATSAPFLTDLATGVKISATTGALVVFIR
ncbi:MAG: FG-GAP-like repeat-containing protein [Candidatus Eisenbacteria bacterium]